MPDPPPVPVRSIAPLAAVILLLDPVTIIPGELPVPDVDPVALETVIVPALVEIFPPDETLRPGLLIDVPLPTAVMLISPESVVTKEEVPEMLMPLFPVVPNVGAVPLRVIFPVPVVVTLPAVIEIPEFELVP